MNTARVCRKRQKGVWHATLPCEAGGRRRYGLPPLPPTSDFAHSVIVFMCLRVCVCVHGVVALFFLGVAGTIIVVGVFVYLCTRVCVCVFV